MGVKNLWKVLAPTSKPLTHTSLDDQRLAIDASIWIYQFLTIVRNKSGNSSGPPGQEELTAEDFVFVLTGFFNRICKLLYLNIKPVFVFDGDIIPELKKETLRRRKEKKEFGKMKRKNVDMRIAALRMHKKMLDKAKNKNPVELMMNKNKGKKKKESNKPLGKVDANDHYYLPSDGKEEPNYGTDLRLPLVADSSPLDGRDDNGSEDNDDSHDEPLLPSVASNDPLLSSSAFHNLPKTLRYQLLSSARLNSRLRTGYSHSQLKELFGDDVLAFSRFQIAGVQRREYWTRRIMDMEGDESEAQNAVASESRKVMGERDLEYMLQRYDLKNIQKTERGESFTGHGMVHRKQKRLREDDTEVRNTDFYDRIEIESSEEDDDDDWEDVPLKKEEKVKEENGSEVVGGDQGLPEELRTFESQIMRQEVYNKRQQESQPKNSFFIFEDQEDEKAAAETFKDQSANLPQSESSQQHTKFDFDSNSNQLGTSIFSKKKIISPESEVDTLHKTDASETNTTDTTTKETDEEPAKKKKKSEPILPPWFAKKSQVSESLVNSAAKDKNKTDSNEGGQVSLVPVADLNEQREVAYLESDSDVEIIDAEEVKDDDIVEIGENGNEIPARQNNVEELVDIEQSSPIIIDDSKEKETAQDEFNSNISQEQNEEESTFESEDQENEENRFIQATQFIEQLAKKRGDLVDEGLNITSGMEHNNGLSVSHLDDNKIENDASDNKDAQLPDPFQITDDVPIKQEYLANTLRPDFDSDSDSDLDLGKATSNLDNGHFSDSDSDSDNEEKYNEEKAATLKFLNTLNPQHVKSVDAELADLTHTSSLLARESQGLSTSIISQCHQLLQRFGIPYITAPSEAEAQCAQLENMGLVDGIVSDDSDVFLFGGRRVLRNFFRLDKYVECYTAAEIESKLNLNRDMLVELAMLLGCDYTDGVKGVGPVKARQIMDKYKSLEAYAYEVKDENQTQHKNIELPEKFPDPAVRKAFLEPLVDTDSTQFEWGKPDLDGLRQFMAISVGWELDRTEGVLIPIVQRLNLQEAQKANGRRPGDGNGDGQMGIKDYFKPL